MSPLLSGTLGCRAAGWNVTCPHSSLQCELCRAKFGFVHHNMHGTLHCVFSSAFKDSLSVCVCVLPGFIEVFSCVGHSTGGSQPLTQRSCGHVHKLLLLLACKYKTSILHFGIFSVRMKMQPWQQLQSASSQRGAEDGPSACKLLFSVSPTWARKLKGSTNLTDGCSHGHRKHL